MDFINMGGHATYVWTSFSVALFVLVANVVLPWMASKKIRTDLQKKFIRENKLK
jgi:heme exporter protein D